MSLRFGEQDGGYLALIFDDQTETTPQADVFGVGECNAQPATVVGVAERVIVDLGSPPIFGAQPSTASGAGDVIKVGSGALQAQSATVVGVGTNFREVTGAGVALAQQAEASGAGIVGIGGEGNVFSRRATVSGVGSLGNQIFGTGDLIAQPPVVSGTGTRFVLGTGSVRSGRGAVVGAGTVFQIAFDYISYLSPYTIGFESPPLRNTYEPVFTRDRQVPTSRSVDFKSVVTYHAGLNPQDEVSYEFSKGKRFFEDQSDYPHGDDDE